MSVSPVLLAALLERWRGCRSVAAVRPLASDLAAGRGSGSVISGGTRCRSSGGRVRAGPGPRVHSVCPRVSCA